MPRRPPLTDTAVLYARLPDNVMNALVAHAQGLGIPIAVAANLVIREGLASLGIPIASEVKTP